MSLPELFPTPKISETGNSFILPQELCFFCSEQDLSEGIIPWSGKLPLKEAESSEEANLHVQKESLGHPEAYSLKLENDQITLKAETPLAYSVGYPKCFRYFSFSNRARRFGIRNRGRSQPESARIYARYQPVQVPRWKNYSG